MHSLKNIFIKIRALNKFSNLLAGPARCLISFNPKKQSCRSWHIMATFGNQELKAQRVSVTCPRPHSLLCLKGRISGKNEHLSPFCPEGLPSALGGSRPTWPRAGSSGLHFTIYKTRCQWTISVPSRREVTQARLIWRLQCVFPSPKEVFCYLIKRWRRGLFPPFGP